MRCTLIGRSIICYSLQMHNPCDLLNVFNFLPLPEWEPYVKPNNIVDTESEDRHLRNWVDASPLTMILRECCHYLQTLYVSISVLVQHLFLMALYFLVFSSSYHSDLTYRDWDWIMKYYLRSVTECRILKILKRSWTKVKHIATYLKSSSKWSFHGKSRSSSQLSTVVLDYDSNITKTENNCL